MKAHVYLFMIVLSMLILGCDVNSEKQALYEKMKQERIECPEGSELRVNDWSKLGLSRECVMRHGKFVGWEYGRKIVEGQYYNGLETGTWIWYDKKGDIDKTVNYENRVEVLSDQEHTSIKQ